MANAILAKLKPVIDQTDAVLDTPACAKLIADTREALGVSQKALAIEMKIAQSYLCDLEGSRRRWSLALWEKAMAALERLVK